MRWHLAKKRWAKSRSEFFYDIRQNIRAFQKAVKHFFVKSKYEKHTKTKAPVYTFVGFLIFAAIGYLVFTSAPNVRQNFKAFELFKKAEDYYQKSDVTQAFWYAYTSYDYEAVKHRYENLKILAETALALDRYESSQFLNELAHHKKATVEDSVLYIKFSLDKQNFAIAEKHFEKVNHLLQSDPVVKLLHLRIINKNWRKNFDEVLQLSRELVHLYKIQDAALDEIYLNIAMREKKYAKEATAYLYQLTQKKDHSSLVALIKAISPLPYNTFTQEQTNSFLVDYLNHPLATHSDRVNAFIESYRRGLVPHDSLEKFLESEFRISIPAKLQTFQLVEIQRILTELNLTHKLPQFIPLEVAYKDKLFLTDYILTLMDLGKFEEAKELSLSGDSQYTKSERNIIDALSRVKKAKLSEMNGNISNETGFTGILGNSAVIAPDNSSLSKDPFTSFFEYGYSSADTEEFSLIEHLFEKLPHTNSLLHYLESVSDKSLHLRTKAQVLILKFHLENRNEEKIQKTLQELTTISGELKDQHYGYILYHKTLYQVEPETTLSTLEAKASRENTPPSIVIALSLGYYLSNKPSIALRTLEECKLHSLFERPGNQVIAALIFDANNRDQDSRHFISNLNFDLLLPPERKLVLRLLQTNNLKTGKI